MQRPTKLSNYPWVVVRFDCTLCQRRGCYRLARLAARYGPEQDLEGLLRDLASTCPYWNERPRKYEPRCGARLYDLEVGLPPPHLPAPPVYRQRQPAREDVPQPPRSRAPDQPYRSPMLSDWPADRPVVVVCKRCGRREKFERNHLLASGDVMLIDLRLVVTADCPLRQGPTDRDRCNTTFEGWPPK